MRPHLEIDERERARVVAKRKQGGNPRVQQPTALTCHNLRWCKNTRNCHKRKLKLTFLGHPSPSGVLLASPTVMLLFLKKNKDVLNYFVSSAEAVALLPSFGGSLCWRRTHRVPPPPCSSSTWTDGSLSKLICHLTWPGDQGGGWMRLLPQATRHSEHLHGCFELIFSSF